ncbi:MAG: hemolysin activation protein [Pirellulaceae bacterium]|nr:MAG: hemolysin activation protein [Pirellulaceae bacterium]
MSGFFSGSEAAFFSLTPLQRRELQRKGRAGQAALRLLEDSERLLMGILFWNLGINLAYFSLCSLIALRVTEFYHHEAIGLVFSLGSVVLIVVVGEFLPKSVALAFPMVLVRFVAFPLSLMLRIADFALPPIKLVTEVSRRIIWPGFQAEPYLELADLDRILQLSSHEANLAEQESRLLRNVIQLTDIRVEEWMRPRTEYRTFRPPVQLTDLGGKRTPTGYILITDPDGKEIQSYVYLGDLARDQGTIDELAQPVLVVPWCTSIAHALESMQRFDRRVAVVVNEFGETVGVLTREDIIDAVFQAVNSQAQPELSKSEIVPEGPGVWRATGLTKLRKLERVIGRPIRTGGSLTIAGAVQEHLHRLPEVGDTCELDGLHLEVIKAGRRGQVLVRIRLLEPPSDNGGEVSP